MSKIEAKKSTTIAINIADSTLVEEYCKAHNILKKDFVGLAVRWFKDNDVDIRSEVSFVSVPAETQANQNNEAKALYTLMSEFITAKKQTTNKDAELAQVRKEKEQAANRLEKAKNDLRRLINDVFISPKTVYSK